MLRLDQKNSFLAINLEIITQQKEGWPVKLMVIQALQRDTEYDFGIKQGDCCSGNNILAG